jgi:hypothetical protein
MSETNVHFPTFYTSDIGFLLAFLFALVGIAATAASPILGHAQLMRICQNELYRHNQGTNNSSRIGGAKGESTAAAAAASTTQLSSNAAVLLSAAQMVGVSSHNNVDRLSQQIATNLEQIQRVMNTNESMLPQIMTGSIRSNTNGLGTSQQRQMLFSPRVSQYARLQQRQQDAVAAAATTARLRREQEQRAAAVAAIIAAQSNHQQQCRMEQLQRDLRTLQQMNILRHDSSRATLSRTTTLSASSTASLALSLAQDPMLGTNMALMRQHQQQQQQEQEHSLQMLRMQHFNMSTSSSALLNLQHQSAMRSSPLYHHHSPIELFQSIGTTNHHDAAYTTPLSLPICLARSAVDEYKLSEHQIFLRQQIEAFQATEDDVMTHTRGRNKPILLGQVGIRCRHCAHLPVSRRQKGSTYFPSNKLGIYQAAQNMSTAHIQCGLCHEMPEDIKLKFIEIMSAKKPNCSNGAGRPYWAQSATLLGLVDTEEGIRFIRDLPPGIVILE